MANKRSLKKQIHYICGDVAGEALMAKIIIPGVDKEAMTDVIIKVADLQSTGLARVNISFDKSPKDFDNISAYRKAKTAYFKQAYRKLSEAFNNQLLEIVKEMNAANAKK